MTRLNTVALMARFLGIACTVVAMLAAGLGGTAGLLADDTGDPKVKVVEVGGAGVDVESAKKDACREAVRQVVGAYVNSRTRIDNDELIEDKVISLSSGFVEKIETLKESKADGLTRVRIRATVRITKVIDTLKANKIAVAAVDGESLGARLTTIIDQRKAEADLIGAALEGCPGKWFKASVVGEPRVDESKVDGLNVPLIVTVKVEADLEAFVASAEKLDKALRATNRETGEFQCDGAVCGTTAPPEQVSDITVTPASCLSIDRVVKPIQHIHERFNGYDGRTEICVMFPVKFLGKGRRSTWRYYSVGRDEVLKHLAPLVALGLPWRVTLLDKSNEDIAIQSGVLGRVDQNSGSYVAVVGGSKQDAGFRGGFAFAPALFLRNGDVMAPIFTCDVVFLLGREEVDSIGSVTVSLE